MICLIMLGFKRLDSIRPLKAFTTDLFSTILLVRRKSELKIFSLNDQNLLRGHTSTPERLYKEFV